MKQTVQVIQENLKAVGIELTLDERTWAAFISDWSSKEIPEMFIMGIAANTGAPDYVFPNQWTTDGAWNAGHYSNPKIDELFAEAARTTDDAKRQSMEEELQQILAEDIVGVPLFHMRYYIAMRRNVQGFENHPLEHFLLDTAWLEQ